MHRLRRLVQGAVGQACQRPGRVSQCGVQQVRQVAGEQAVKGLLDGREVAGADELCQEKREPCAVAACGDALGGECQHELVELGCCGQARSMVEMVPARRGGRQDVGVAALNARFSPGGCLRDQETAWCIQAEPLDLAAPRRPRLYGLICPIVPRFRLREPSPAS